MPQTSSRTPLTAAHAAPAPAARTTTSRNSRVGRRGEQAAAAYLEARGYHVVDRNWRSPYAEQRGELDLVLRHRGALVVCEVKARTGGPLAHPAEAVTPEKLARLRRLAALWLREHARAPASRVSGGRATPILTLLAAALHLLPAHRGSSRSGPSRSAPSTHHPSHHRPPRPSALPTEPKLRIDVVSVRLGPREPFPVLSLDHLKGVG